MAFPYGKRSFFSRSAPGRSSFGTSVGHPAALMVHANGQRRFPHPFDLLAERGQLLGRLVIPREKNDRARGGMRETATVVVGQREAEDIHHRRARRQPYFSHSRITVAKA